MEWNERTQEIQTSPDTLKISRSKIHKWPVIIVSIKENRIDRSERSNILDRLHGKRRNCSLIE